MTRGESQDNEDRIVSWRKSEKDRTLTVVKAAEDRSVIWHALRRISQLLAVILATMVTFKAAGLGAYWSMFVAWMAHQ